MREIDARVTGFDYTTHHSYTTEVEVDGRTWTLGIRFSTFFDFYTRLTALEKHFQVEFPRRGGLFFSPPPEERQEQLDDFLLSTLAYFDMRGHPKRMEALLGELLQIPQHMDVKDDEERTASEGSSVAEEVLMDTPLPGHDHDDFGDHSDVESHEDSNKVEAEEDNHVQEDTLDTVEDKVEASPEQDAVATIEPAPMNRSSSAPEPADNQAAEITPISKTRSKSAPEPKLVKQTSQELTGGAVAKKYIEMLRRKTTLVNGAIQAAVVVTLQENVEKAKAQKAEDQKRAVSETKAAEAASPAAAIAPPTIPAAVEEPDTEELEEKPEAPLPEEAPATSEQETAEEPEISAETTSVSVSAATHEDEEAVEMASSPVEITLSPEAPVEVAAVTQSTPEKPTEMGSEAGLATETEAEPAATVSDEDEVASVESSVDDAASESSVEEPTPTEDENPVMNWFRRMGTFGQSSADKETAAQKELEEKEAARVQAEADAAAKVEQQAKIEQEAREKAEAEAEQEAREKKEAELLHAEQEMNLRLMRYRHPVFFQGFNCDVGTSRYSLPERHSDGIVV